MCNELVRDLLCTIAMKLQGSLYGLLMRLTCTDERAPQVVRTLLQRLAEEQEEAWLDAICQELVNYGACQRGPTRRDPRCTCSQVARWREDLDPSGFHRPSTRPQRKSSQFQTRNSKPSLLNARIEANVTGNTLASADVLAQRLLPCRISSDCHAFHSAWLRCGLPGSSSRLTRRAWVPRVRVIQTG
jgi:hypothetical protein